jgi:acetyl-CoA carboxylase carboxyltransferase component
VAAFNDSCVPFLFQLLGRQVYTSNNQLGGVQIMYYNGVSHATARDDLEGVSKIINWLSFVPKTRGAALPITVPVDCPTREVRFMPTKAPYDPRHMLAGRKSPADESVWEDGFLDKGSWDEILGGWANTVITGRGRLGGIPVGVIAVETRTVEVQLPADPANIDSEAKVCLPYFKFSSVQLDIM